MTTPADIHLLDAGTRVEMFELDLREITGIATDRYYFHAGLNKLMKPLVWQGVTYQPFPVEASGFEVNAKGTLPRPSLVASNVTGVISALARQYDDLVGARVVRRVTFGRYLDEANFSGTSNLLSYSEDLTQTDYTKTNVTVTSNVTAAPDGATTADRVRETAINGGHRVNRSLTFFSGFSYTISVYVKPDGRDRIGLELPSACFGVAQAAVFDLTNQTVTVTSGSPTASIVEVAANGFLRCRLTARAVATASATLFMRLISTGTTNSYTGDTTKGVFMWGAQLVMLDVPGSYQKTLAATSLNPSADPTQYLPDDVYYVERKVRDTPEAVEFELASAMDLHGVRVPNRVVTVGSCSWQYRAWSTTLNRFVYGPSPCPYTGSTYFDSADASTTDPTKDSCSRSVSGCKARFGARGLLPYGGFPAARAYKL